MPPTSAIKPDQVQELAKKFKALHVSANPVILANVHDAVSAEAVALQPGCEAIASASWAIAATQGIEDDDMTFEQNLVGIKNIIAGLSKAGKRSILPLSVDLQNGYDVQTAVREVIALGCVGANIEDVDHVDGQLRSLEDAVAVIKLALKTASEAGVPDFVINARTDVFLFGGTIDEVERRAKAYIEAGATTAFVWGGKKKDLSFEDVQQLSRTLKGHLAVQGPGIVNLSLKQLFRAGVSRISYGPWLLRKSIKQYEDEARSLMLLDFY